MKFKNITIAVIVGLLYGCSSSPSMSSKAGIYDETKNRYLTGIEIKSLMTGKTMEYPDKSKTKEYIHKSGIVYAFYEKDKDYNSGHWCVMDNKFCFDYEGMKLDCPTITMKSNGKIFYEDEGYITLTNGDKYDLKNTYSEYAWTINKKRNCK